MIVVPIELHRRVQREQVVEGVVDLGASNIAAIGRLRDCRENADDDYGGEQLQQGKTAHSNHVPPDIDAYAVRAAEDRYTLRCSQYASMTRKGEGRLCGLAV